MTIQDITQKLVNGSLSERLRAITELELSGDPNAIEQLNRALRDPDPNTREAAQGALGRLEIRIETQKNRDSAKRHEVHAEREPTKDKAQSVSVRGKDDKPPNARKNAATCKPLLDTATPDMYRANAFRITGLPVDATIREITRHADKLKMMEELGEGQSLHTGALALNPPPGIDQIREAIQRLKDPEQRIVDEFFWFWPRQFGQSASDPALKALSTGDPMAALKIWTALETSPSDGPVAMHNVAVMRHFLALKWENYYAKTGEFTEQKIGKTEKHWRGAFKRWELLAVDDLFWEKITARIKQLDDPRLTTGFARRMRATLPHALDKINAELAVRYAEGGQMDLARVHVLFMRETNQGLDDVQKTAELVLTPATTRLKQQIQRAKDRAAKDLADSLEAARELLEHARRALALFELFFGKESDARNDLSDDVADVCSQLPIAYYNSTGDDTGCLDLLRSALPFAISIDLRQQIEKNIETLTGNLNHKKLGHVYGLLREIQESSDDPKERLNRFKSVIVPVLSKLKRDLDDSEALAALADSVAIVLRAVSVAAWNTHQDARTALDAVGLALKFVRSTELKQRLNSDENALLEIARQVPPHLPAQSKTPSLTPKSKTSDYTKNGCVVMLAIVFVLSVLAGLLSENSTPSTAPKTIRPAAPEIIPPAAPATDTSGPSNRIFTTKPNMTPSIPEYIRRVPPSPTAIATPSPRVAEIQPSPTIAKARRLRVVNVAQNDVLNVRETPSPNSRIVAKLRPNYNRLIQIGSPVRRGNQTWVLVQVETVRGYVNTNFINVLY